jgi:molybdopterin converting factor small subunit
MTVRIVAFARIREVVGAGAFEWAAQDGATAGDVFAALTTKFPQLGELARSIRFVRDGAFVGAATIVRDGDELGLLPPYGGG